jgi:hypothetical protein
LYFQVGDHCFRAARFSDRECRPARHFVGWVAGVVLYCYSVRLFRFGCFFIALSCVPTLLGRIAVRDLISSSPGTLEFFSPAFRRMGSAPGATEQGPYWDQVSDICFPLARPVAFLISVKLAPFFGGQLLDFVSCMPRT